MYNCKSSENTTAHIMLNKVQCVFLADTIKYSTTHFIPVCSDSLLRTSITHTCSRCLIHTFVSLS